MVDGRTLTGFADLLEGTTGLATPETNRSHLKRVIARKARSRSITPEELLRYSTESSGILQEIIDAAMIGETYFFREVAQFRYLRNAIAPELIAQGRLVTAWSASCSSGEEAVSLAVLLHDVIQERTGSGKQAIPIRVYAGDIRSDVPERIRNGSFPLSSLRRDGREYHELFRAHYVTAVHDRTLTVAPEIIDLIEPYTINLFADSLDRIPNDLDVVFFRNTLIYAPAANRKVIIGRIVDKIRTGGYLFLANSELPFVSHPQLELVEGGGVYCLRKSETVPVETPGRISPPRSTEQELSPVPPQSAPARSAIGEPSMSWSIVDVIGAITEPMGETPPDLAEAGRLMAALFADLDEEHFDRVDEFLTELKQSGVADSVFRYCTAWTAYSRGRRTDAANLFSDAITADETIWPAFFYRARLTEEQDPKSAREDFTACIRIIDRESTCSFRFLVGGFDSRQIRALCVRWIERIDAETVGSSHGA